MGYYLVNIQTDCEFIIYNIPVHECRILGLVDNAPMLRPHSSARQDRELRLRAALLLTITKIKNLKYKRNSSVKEQ